MNAREAAWFVFGSAEPMTDERRATLAAAYLMRRDSWPEAIEQGPPTAEECRALRAIAEPMTAEAVYAQRELGLRRAEKPKPKVVRRCAGCRVKITGTEDYTPGCATCSDRRKKRRQRGQEVDEE